jgi:tRNA pseudouridine32 synthase/23S rRNA pseudouridine746 synthase
VTSLLAQAPANILWRNEHFAFVEKFAGTLSVPSRQGRSDPRSVVGIWLQETLGSQIFPVHRLDFEVRGLMLWALSGKAQGAASTWFENQLAHKTYQALTEIPEVIAPELLNAEGVLWQCQLLRGKKRAYESVQGKQSQTRAKILSTSEKTQLCLWELQPKTGRSHQLRYEMFRHGWPIVGDTLYGSLRPYQEQSIALEALTLKLPREAQDKWGLPLEFSLEALLSKWSSA